MSSHKKIDWVKAVDYWLSHPHEFGHLLGFKKLTPLHGEWIKFFLKAKRISPLQAHRGSYKTTCGIVALVLMFMIWPNLRVIIMRKTEKAASEVVELIQKIFETSSVVRAYVKWRWNLDSVKTKTWSKTHTTFAFKTALTVQPSISGFGIGGAIVGAHCDYIWCDDIVNMSDRYSTAEREMTRAYWRELGNIVDPGKPRMITFTPWHEEDVEAEIPAELWEGRKFPLGTVDLPPEDMAEIMERKKITPYAEWCANFELRHVEDKDTLGAFPTVDEWGCVYSVAFIDQSFSDHDDTDSTAVAIAGVRTTGEIIFTGRKWQRSIADVDTRREIIQFLDIYTPVESVLELQSTGSKGAHISGTAVFFVDALRATERILRTKVKNYWTIKHQLRNKHERISATIAAHRDKIKMLTSTQSEFSIGVARYSKNAAHDDEADALAGAIDTLATSPIVAEYAKALGIIKAVKR